MSMEQLDQLAKAQEPLLVSPEVFQQLGTITRTLHDTMQRLGVMPKLQVATDGLPDARSRLNYIATKTAAAAEKVLNSVDQAKAEHAAIADQTRSLAAALQADPVKAVATGSVMNFVGDVEAATARIDRHLTDIMMAQDFHDLTGQVVAKVDGQVDAGVYALQRESLAALKGSGHKLARMPAPANAAAQPLLVLVHGTFVDTFSTFGKLWAQHPQRVNHRRP